jgi:hypothetical protein
MKHRHLLIVVICLILLTWAIGPWMHEAEAQTQETWSSVSRLSTNKGKASEASLVADQFGSVHVFWTEELEDNRLVIQYAYYEGETWSTLTDIHVTQPFKTIGNVSPTVDQNGTLHLIWSEGDSGPAYYTSAPANNATSAQKWEQPRVINVPSNRIKLQVDSSGVLHVLYVKFLGQEQGIYYIHSEDEGKNWSDPIWLDPDIIADYGPRALNFEIDDTDGLHAAWYYVPREDLGGDWVRYIHSLDGGNTWSEPFTIDKLDQEAIDNDEVLSAAGPIMAVQGQNVHIIWAGGKLHYRHHRYSTDAGRTWSESRRIFGELNGQAFDGLTVDATGRIHFFGQIRFPMGIYHSVWDGDEWTRPSLVYLIRYSSTDPEGDEIAAHNTHPAVRAGNQLVLTFTDAPSDPIRRLFVMERTLDDITPSAAFPTPTPVVESTPQSTTPTAQPTAITTPRSFGNAPSDNGNSSTGEPLLFGFIATLLLTGSAISLRLLKIRN